MQYDDAERHVESAVAEGQSPEAGGIHIGMFLAWIILRGMEGELLKEDAQEGLKAVRKRQMTGTEFLFKYCDGLLNPLRSPVHCNISRHQCLREVIA